MFLKRKDKRLSTLATAKIDGAFTGEALLKDLSITGCKLEHTMLIDVLEGQSYTARIKPEAAANIGEFEINIEARWVNVGNCACEAGFCVIESPKGKEFQRYVDYIDYRSARK
ncbi:hypothetical protein AGMMS50212_11370 [Spirochaetia bacterium]|nr:hypothetical protein AGMMS50212_11370 [Spirochaetia bacterium]